MDRGISLVCDPGEGAAGERVHEEPLILGSSSSHAPRSGFPRIDSRRTTAEGRDWRSALTGIPTPILALLWLDVFLAVMHAIGPTMPTWAAPRFSREHFWDLEYEVNLPSWYSSVQLALIGVLLLSFAAVSARRRRATVVMAGVGLLFLFLSLDELTMLHENFGGYLATVFGTRRGTALDQTGPWMLIAAPAFLAAIALAAYVGRDLLRGRRKVQGLFAAGFGVYVAASAGAELLVNFVSRPQGTILVEETGEMVGATLLLWATYELARSHGVHLLGPAARDNDAPHAVGRGRRAR